MTLARRSTTPEASDVRRRAQQSKYRPDCRAATIINPPRPSKYIPDRQRFPIQIVALHWLTIRSPFVRIINHLICPRVRAEGAMRRSTSVTEVAGPRNVVLRRLERRPSTSTLVRRLAARY